MTVFGYARVSTSDQTTALQTDALRAEGVDALFVDHGISGSTTSRPELDKMLGSIHEGDTVIVWRLDRLGRSLPHLVATVEAIHVKGVAFRSLTEQINTGTATGKLVFHLFAALAEFERNLIRERTTAGMAAAKARGAKIGRPAALSADQVAHARLLADSGVPVKAVAASLGVGESTLYRALADHRCGGTG